LEAEVDFLTGAWSLISEVWGTLGLGLDAAALIACLDDVFASAAFSWDAFTASSVAGFLDDTFFTASSVDFFAAVTFFAASSAEGFFGVLFAVEARYGPC
jgi:hypothetical protein